MLSTDTERMLPFFWMRGEDEATLRNGVRQVQDSGCGALCAESRTHPDYLGEGWWKDIGILLDECEKRGMKMWILDDMLFPSGYAAGRAKGTSACRMMLTERHMDVKGPLKGGAILVENDERTWRPGEGVVAIVAAEKLEKSNRQDAFVDIGGACLGRRIDLTPAIREGMAYWDVPEGVWRVFVISCAYVSERTPARFFANPLLPAGGKMMIDTVYQPHYEHFKEYFGKTLMGFFSDEPAMRAGRGLRVIPGEYPQLPAPWSAEMLSLMEERLGEHVRALLPGIWYDIGAETSRVRYALMDVASRLYEKNYCNQLGDWCRAHGVAYIGHLIEQNNAHARLGSGAGNFFRAIGGQDMAGFDIVLHEIRPELRGGYHAWKSQDFEADDDFFRFMLMQMAVSSAHIDPKKRGRTMCEIFGAYGWQEDMAEMRYLANLTLSRGVNYFVPHAFSFQPYPDKDSPAHFDERMNPLTPLIGQLFGYMARVGTMIDGGAHVARTAVLYFAEAEWACGQGGRMLTQSVVRALNERQIECNIVPIDAVETADFDLLLIPWGKKWPRRLLESCQRLIARGKKVCFVGAPPEDLSEGEGPLAPLLEGIDTIRLEDAAEIAQRCAPLPYRAVTRDSRVHLYPYQKHGENLYLLFNEDTEEEALFAFETEDLRPAYVLDREDETCRKADAVRVAGGQRITLTLERGQMLCVLLTDSEMPCDAPVPATASSAELAPTWTISLKAAGTDDFVPYKTTDTLFSLTAADEKPRFSGTARYEAAVNLPEGCVGIDLGLCRNAAKLWLDGEEVGVRLAAPFRFMLKKPVSGEHTLRVETTNAAVFQHRDELSFFAYISPSGFLGPVSACIEKEENL